MCFLFTVCIKFYFRSARRQVHAAEIRYCQCWKTHYSLYEPLLPVLFRNNEANSSLCDSIIFYYCKLITFYFWMSLSKSALPNKWRACNSNFEAVLYGRSVWHKTRKSGFNGNVFELKKIVLSGTQIQWNYRRFRGSLLLLILAVRIYTLVQLLC